MKKIISSIIVLVFGLLTSHTTQAQGIVYLSNLDQPSAGSVAVGYNLWQAAGFFTGTNSGGYVLNSIQLAMTDASLNPSNFTVMIYQTSPAGLKPGNSLSSLNGSTSPVTAGIYTYTSASTLTLLPDFYYFIVLTGGTIPVRGDYEWSYAGANSYNPSGGWSSTGFWVSNNQLSWSGTTTGNFQFSINAMAVPEPGILSLFGLGGLGFLWQRRKAKALK